MRIWQRNYVFINERKCGYHIMGDGPSPLCGVFSSPLSDPFIFHSSLPHGFHAAIIKAVEAGHDPNEVESAGNTPLHMACWRGWTEGVEMLLDLGAQLNASNNAGLRPYHMYVHIESERISSIHISYNCQKPLTPDRNPLNFHPGLRICTTTRSPKIGRAHV